MNVLAARLRITPGGILIVPTMDIKPSPSGESFRFFVFQLDWRAWEITEQVLTVVTISSTILC